MRNFDDLNKLKIIEYHLLYKICKILFLAKNEEEIYENLYKAFSKFGYKKFLLCLFRDKDAPIIKYKRIKKNFVDKEIIRLKDEVKKGKAIISKTKYNKVLLHSLTIPLTLDNKDFGFINIYSERYFYKGEISLLEQVSKEIAMGINSIKKEKQIDTLRNQISLIMEKRVLYIFMWDIDSGKISIVPDIMEHFRKKINTIDEFLDCVYEQNIKDIFKNIKECTIDKISLKLKIKTDENVYLIFDFLGRRFKKEFIGILVEITERESIERNLSKIEKYNVLSDVLRRIGHDFNNILTGIIGNLSILKMISKDNNDSIECIKDIEKASMRAKELASSMLIFSKIEGIKKEKLDILKLINEVVDFVLRGTNINVEYKINGEGFEIEGDSLKLSEMIQNIVFNAKEEMLNGGKLTIKIKKEKINYPYYNLFNEDYIIIMIKDTGNGIPDEIKDRVFLPFFTTKNKGTGMGLPISLKIVKEHNGYIAFESKKGEGTEFIIYLPVRQRD